MHFDYYVNGWREGMNHFMDLGRFTEDEIIRLNSGEVIVKGSNEFWIERKDD